jgi:hypothetical protein
VATYFSYMKTALILSAGLFVLAFASAGCDEKKTDAKPAATTAAPGAIKSSCNNIKTLSTCTEYDDKAFALGEGFVKGACEATSGKYASATCPPEKLLGTCAIDGGQLKKYYADGTLAYKADDAAKDCKDLSNGKWSAK